jgi:hypothetical protein
MADENRRIIIDRANRMLRQSKMLRKMSDELLHESNDIRRSVKATKEPKPRRKSKR